MATQADDKSPMVWTSEDIIDVFVLNSNLLNKHKHKHKMSVIWHTYATYEQFRVYKFEF